jgi:hypothetical protein
MNNKGDAYFIPQESFGLPGDQRGASLSMKITPMRAEFATDFPALRDTTKTDCRSRPQVPVPGADRTQTIVLADQPSAARRQSDT